VGLVVDTRGLTTVLTDTLDSLQTGLIVAIIVIFLMLAANFQSFKVSLVTLCTVPAVLLGSLGLLMITGSTLNLQSYMGMIMSVGVSLFPTRCCWSRMPRSGVAFRECVVGRAGSGGFADQADPDDQCGDGGRA
jgi:uncharacterized membrane protein